MEIVKWLARDQTGAFDPTRTSASFEHSFEPHQPPKGRVARRSAAINHTEASRGEHATVKCAFMTSARQIADQRQYHYAARIAGGAQPLKEDCLRTLLIGALAATLAGCSRQPPPQAATGSCTGTNGSAHLERTAGPPIKLGTFRINSAAMDTKSASVRKPEKSSSAHARHGARLGSKTAKSTRIAAKAKPPASRVPLPHSSPKTRLQPAGNAVATESETARANIAEPHPTVGLTNFSTRMIEAQVAAALALAERITVATVAPAPGIKAKNRDSSSRPETLARGNTEKPASANDTDLLVALLMARPNIKSVPDLTGETIAIDDRNSAFNGSVRTAIVAAGAPEVQLSEGQATAINRLVNGEVPAAILALVSADAAEGFSEIAGFKIFHIPLSPRSLKAQP